MQAGTKVVIVMKHKDYNGRVRRVGDLAIVDSFPGQGYGIASENETMLRFDKSNSGPIATPNQYFRIVNRPDRQKKTIFK